MTPWPPPQRTMNPREIVTGEVRQMAGKVKYLAVRHDGITIEFCDGYIEDFLHPVETGTISFILVSRPMW